MPFCKRALKLHNKVVVNVVKFLDHFSSIKNTEENFKIFFYEFNCTFI